MNVTNQRIVIIGGSSGIGLATAQVLAAAGARVVIAGRQQEKVTQALATLEGSASGEAVMQPRAMRLRPSFTALVRLTTLS